MDRYEFYKNKKGKLICNAVINGESVSYFDEDALYFFRRLGKEKCRKHRKRDDRILKEVSDDKRRISEELQSI